MPNTNPEPPNHPTLKAPDLYRHCDPDIFPFANTAEVEDFDGTFGQSRALAALEFGVGMKGRGYNLFVLANPGSHRHRIVREFLQSQTQRQLLPSDWVYVNNFEDDRKPLAIEMPAGEGRNFKLEMEALLEELQAAIPAAFESEQYRNRILEINQEFEERVQSRLKEIEEEARSRGLSLVPTPQGFGIAPVRNGKLLSDEEFAKLPEQEQQSAREAIDAVSEKLRRHLEEVPRWHKERYELIKAFNREITKSAIREPIARLRDRFAQYAKVARYLEALEEDVLQNAREFLPQQEQERPGISLGTPHRRRYAVNLMVDGQSEQSNPIVYESKPSLQNLLGRVEHLSQFGALLTDFTMIRPGALHRGNGGYLIVDANRILSEPYAWPALKRSLEAREIRIESLAEAMSLVSTASLEPEPIPLNLKVILVGERFIYHLLCMYDPDFANLFKVAADFEDRIDRNPENTVFYGRLLGTLARRDSLRPFSREAVARLVEYSARIVGDAEKLSMRLRDTADLLREADYWAAQAGAETVDRVHTQQAIDARIHRSDRLRDEMQDETLRSNILIATSGAQVGQINGLSVISMGDYAFGRPVRITATARIGEGRIVDIEREAELGGRIHSKAVMIVSSYLSSRYAPDMPLSLRASLVFEQSYSGIEGDSASVAETCALLSSLADVPIHQSLAVTGSINQHGEVQVIGGVNEKIEGFYDVCRARGLDGRQGVLIPRENQKHLMLREDVVEAVSQGQFHVWPIGTVDHAIELLTGRKAGRRGDDGKFPSGSVNQLVEERLSGFAKALRKFGASLARRDEQQSGAGDAW